MMSRWVRGLGLVVVGLGGAGCVPEIAVTGHGSAACVPRPVLLGPVEKVGGGRVQASARRRIEMIDRRLAMVDEKYSADSSWETRTKLSDTSSSAEIGLGILNDVNPRLDLKTFKIVKGSSRLTPRSIFHASGFTMSSVTYDRNDLQYGGQGSAEHSRTLEMKVDRLELLDLTGAP